MPTNRPPCANGCTNWRKNSVTAYRRTLKHSTARNHKGAGESGCDLSVSVFASRQAREGASGHGLKGTPARKCSNQTCGEIPLPRPLAHYVRSLVSPSRQPGGCGLSWSEITVIKTNNIIVFQVVIWPVQLNPENENPPLKEANFPAMS